MVEQEVKTAVKNLVTLMSPSFFPSRCRFWRGVASHAARHLERFSDVAERAKCKEPRVKRQPRNEEDREGGLVLEPFTGKYRCLHRKSADRQCQLEVVAKRQ
jgi:hypothetical protein